MKAMKISKNEGVNAMPGGRASVCKRRRKRLMTTEAEKMQQTEEKTRDMAATIDAWIEEIYSQRMGFALIVFKFNKPGNCNYISNGKRASMIEALKEAATRLELNQIMPASIGPVQ